MEMSSDLVPVSPQMSTETPVMSLEMSLGVRPDVPRNVISGGSSSPTRTVESVRLTEASSERGLPNLQRDLSDEPSHPSQVIPDIPVKENPTLPKQRRGLQRSHSVML